MKKFFALAAIIFAFCLSSAFAKLETLPIAERPSQFIQMDYGRTFNRGIEPDRNWASAEYSFEWQPFCGFAGAQLDDNYYDLTLRTSYLPIASYHQNGVWRFGVSTAWHNQRAFDSYSEHDILQEIEVRWISTRGLTFTARHGYSLRITTFDAQKDTAIWNGDWVAYAEVDKVWKSGFELFTSVGTYNLYRYPLFFCPQWTFGAAWNFQNAIRLGALAEIGMTDFFASVAYFNHILIKCNLRIMF